MYIVPDSMDAATALILKHAMRAGDRVPCTMSWGPDYRYLVEIPHGNIVIVETESGTRSYGASKDCHVTALPSGVLAALQKRHEGLSTTAMMIARDLECLVPLIALPEAPAVSEPKRVKP